MNGARTAILARVRAAQRTALLPDSHVPGNPQRSHAASIAEDLVARFANELTTLGVEVHHAETEHAVREAVRAQTTGRAVLSWDSHALPYEVFGMLAGPALGSAPREEQAAAEIGLTACDAAVAETGSLVLISGPGRARSVSLLPPVHLAVVQLRDVVATLADAFERLEHRMRTAASCTVITGPSRTADIELTLTLGIHGPGRVIVVIGP